MRFRPRIQIWYIVLLAAALAIGYFARGGAASSTAAPPAQSTSGSVSVASNSNAAPVSESAKPAAVPPTQAPVSKPPATVAPTSTTAPTATTVPTAAPTSTVVPSATPVPKPGTVLYQADWSKGLNGWAGSADWKWVAGMLVDDGTGNGNIIVPPFQAAVPDYAVETQIQIVSTGCCGHSFGPVLRGDGKSNDTNYRGAMVDGGSSARILRGGDTLASKDFSAGKNAHTYRIEAKGNTLKYSIDGAVVLEATDNRFLTGGQVGIWVYGDQLNVRSFQVVAL
jgi:hypothetical protein